MNRKSTTYILAIISIFLGTSEISPNDNIDNKANTSHNATSDPSISESLKGYWKYEYDDSISTETVIYDFTGEEALIIYQSNPGHTANTIKTDSKIYKYFFDSYKEYLIYYSYNSNIGEYYWNLWKVIKLNDNILSIANIDSGDEPFIDSDRCRQIICYYEENKISYDNDDIRNMTKIIDTDFNSWWNYVSKKH
jgi:hypothetical protein